MEQRIENARALADELEQTNEDLHSALIAAEKARERAEESEARVRLSERREHFLAEASRVLGSSIDFETTIQKVARLAVPELADWCGVDLIDENGELQQIAVAHVDPTKVEWAFELRRRYPASMDSPTGVAAVIRNGKSEFYPDISDEMVEASAKDAEHLAILRDLALHGVIIAPLKAAEQTFGALSLISARGSRRYVEADVALAEELAHRAALAIQSANLYSAEQDARRRAEETAERTRRLQTVTAALSQAVTPAAVADAALADSIDALGAAHGAVFTVSPDGKTVEIVKSIGLSDQTVRDFKTFSVDANLPLSDAIRERRPIFLENRQAIVERYPGLREANSRAATTAWAMTPLMVGQRVVGGIAWGYYEERQFGETDQQFIDVLARQCALAVERAQLYAAERAAREAAQTANRAKSDFLATMSHELRTPINAIQGYAQLLDLGIPGPVTETQREYLYRLSASADHLLGLVNEVLDLAKIESGTITVQRESNVAGETVDAALSLIRPQAASKELALSEKCEGARATPYVGDEHRVRQILANLLSNAVKFTEPHGKITVDCMISNNPPAEVKENRDGPFVVFRIADTGSGIAKDQMERIFDPFTQADTVQKNPYTRGWSGTGLGLTISRRLARLMGGELTVESSPGVGSEFRLWMPMSERRAKSRAGATPGPVTQTVAEAAIPDAVVGTADAAPIPGLASIANALLKETPAIVHAFVERVRSNGQSPERATDSQIEDHMATFVADSAIGLRLLEVAGGDPSDLLRDSSAIMRTIMEQHGNQRFRLAWSEEAIAAEMDILAEVVCEAVRRISADDRERADQACEALGRFIGQAARQTIAAYRFSAATLQLSAASN